MKIDNELPLILFYKKVLLGTEKVKCDPKFSKTVSDIAGLPEPTVDVPQINISIESITIHDTNTLADAIEMIRKVAHQNEQLVPGIDLIEHEIGTQLLCYLARVKGLKMEDPEPIDRLIKSFEMLLRPQKYKCHTCGRKFSTKNEKETWYKNHQYCPYCLRQQRLQ